MTLSPDFRMLDETGSRTANLDKLYKALVTIKPTSVESERAFSMGGNFCTKVRNRMAPSTLSALVSLKSYFKSFKQEWNIHLLEIKSMSTMLVYINVILNKEHMIIKMLIIVDLELLYILPFCIPKKSVLLDRIYLICYNFCSNNVYFHYIPGIPGNPGKFVRRERDSRDIKGRDIENP